MGIETALIAIGVAASVAGTAVGVMGAQKQAKAGARAEELRKQQMELEANRKQKEIIRNGQMARAQAQASATAQGADAGSGLQGGLAQITGAAGNQRVATEQNRQIGGQIFDANAQADRAGGMVAFGGGLTSLGNGLLQNYGTFSRVFGQ